MVAEVAVERERVAAATAAERERVALELARLAREPIVSPEEADMREHRHNRQDWGTYSNLTLPVIFVFFSR
jgi:hypothetical protein